MWVLVVHVSGNHTAVHDDRDRALLHARGILRVDAGAVPVLRHDRLFVHHDVQPADDRVLHALLPRRDPQSCRAETREDRAIRDARDGSLGRFGHASVRHVPSVLCVHSHSRSRSTTDERRADTRVNVALKLYLTLASVLLCFQFLKVRVWTEFLVKRWMSQMTRKFLPVNSLPVNTFPVDFKFPETSWVKSYTGTSEFKISVFRLVHYHYQSTEVEN